jgi:hypothetical protein
LEAVPAFFQVFYFCPHSSLPGDLWLSSLSFSLWYPVQGCLGAKFKIFEEGGKNALIYDSNKSFINTCRMYDIS